MKHFICDSLSYVISSRCQVDFIKLYLISYD